LLAHASFKKRSGTPISELAYLLVLWTCLKIDPIGMFARESPKTFPLAQKDAYPTEASLAVKKDFVACLRPSRAKVYPGKSGYPRQLYSQPDSA